MTHSSKELLRRALNVVALAVVVGALAYCAWFRLTGGHWERVETPSMGTSAPVGTLLWVRPVDPSDLAVGDVVSFHRPGTPDGPVYSHRVAVMHDDGTFGTAGDLSGPDAWQVQPSDVVGRVAHTWLGAGWLVEVAPVLLLGSALTGTLVVVVRRPKRLPLGLLGASLTLAAVLVVYQPLSGAELIGVEQGDAKVTATYVDTGLLPIRISGPHGERTEIRPGQSGSVTVHSPGGRVEVRVAPEVPPWLWVFLLAANFGPAVLSAARGRRQPSRHRGLVAFPV